MAEHYKTLSAVFPIIINKQNQILLARRANTGYRDGKWDFAGSGHVDENETATQAVIREAKEEMGILVSVNDVKFAHLSHRIGKNGNRTYYDIYFFIKAFTGIPFIAEPEKCSGLRWFGIDGLPEDMIDIRKKVLYECLNANTYSEFIIE